jgi:hypothetical protein
MKCENLKKICRQIIRENNVHQLAESYPGIKACRHLIVVEVAVHAKAYKTLSDGINGIIALDIFEDACEKLAL